ncbi:glutathione S-transferase N-terminal domain-containing protein [Marinobacterium sp. YM272]|uniref:glutathione S-transferase N-terminal domain-containing protein n=1 Tax=Marinobacterium sp. YM272 TaxID=3421654 RepID=UPI003D7F4B3B
MIDLYTWSTPNGRKVSIMLEACHLHYNVHPVDIKAGDQHAEEFLRISPNNKIPAIVDEEGPDGEPISIFESGAILLYLAEKTGLFLPDTPRKRYQALEWLMWQKGGFGPFLGQAHHFNRFVPEPVPYAEERYKKEARRLWSVLDKQLDGREFVVDELSIADFAIYPWACRHEWQAIDTADYPSVAAWMARMARLSFVQRGMQVP